MFLKPFIDPEQTFPPLTEKANDHMVPEEEFGIEAQRMCDTAIDLFNEGLELLWEEHLNTQGDRIKNKYPQHGIHPEYSDTSEAEVIEQIRLHYPDAQEEDLYFSREEYDAEYCESGLNKVQIELDSVHGRTRSFTVYFHKNPNGRPSTSQPQFFVIKSGELSMAFIHRARIGGYDQREFFIEGKSYLVDEIYGRDERRMHSKILEKFMELALHFSCIPRALQIQENREKMGAFLVKLEEM